MLKRLRIKFVCINMTIVTVMLLAIFATVLYFTQKNLERESIDMMQSVALNPVQPGVRPAILLDDEVKEYDFNGYFTSVSVW